MGSLRMMRGRFSFRLLGAVTLLFVFAVSWIAAAEPDTGLEQVAGKAAVQRVATEAGGNIEMYIIDSPPWPPVGAVRPVATSIPRSAVILTEVPTSTWTYGCSATAAGMMFGCYDRTGYPNMYTGPTNGGVCPLTDLGQGTGAPITGSCHIIATMNGFDGYVVKGHVDDYWIAYLSPGPDPWQGNWAEHAWADCTADFMGTNQWKWDWNLNGNTDANVDGSTTIWSNGSGAKLYDFIPGPEYGLPQTELCHGMRLFAESRGYTVVQNYTQRIDAVASGGFSFADYMAEIDAGRPVMIQLEGHSMAGVGYDMPNIVYLHDTWDNLLHTMTWGGTYGSMAHWAMTVIELTPPVVIGVIQHGTVWAGSDWTTVNLTEPFTDPVVVAGPATSMGWEPGVVRMRNVTPTSFEIKFQEWDYLDGYHCPEQIHWIAVDRGVYDLGGGQKLIADSFLTNKIGVLYPKWVSFPEAFSGTPVVLTQVQTFNGSDAVTDRICGVYPNGMRFSMQKQESAGHTHADETVGYLAVTQGVTNLLSVPCEVKRTAAVVTHNPYMLSGRQGHAVVRVREEQSKDAETLHWTGEKVGFISLAGQPVVVADMQTCNGIDPCELRCTLLSQVLAWEDGVVSANHQWKTVSLAGTYVDPVVLAGPATYTGKAPGEIRVRNVTKTSFQIRFQEWDYLDGWHCYEKIHWMAMERGVWDVQLVGAVWTADEFLTKNANVYSPSWVTLPLALTSASLVVATQQTANGASCVTERISNVGRTGFKVALQEEEAADAIHAQENIGYFFWGAGTGGVPVTGAALSAGIQPLRTGRSGVSPTAAWYYYIVEEKSKDAETWHGWETLGCLTFSGTPLGQPPYILDLQTCNGADPCTLRLAYLTTAGAARTLSGAQALGLPGSGLYGLLVRAQSEGGAELRAVEIAVGEAVAEGLPLARACKPGETVALSAPMSIADRAGLLAFSHWEVDGVPAELGQATIQVEMTSDREAVAFYVSGN